MPIHMELARIIISEINDQQVIYLREVDGERTFPILIGLFEAHLGRCLPRVFSRHHGRHRPRCGATARPPRSKGSPAGGTTPVQFLFGMRVVDEFPWFKRAIMEKAIQNIT